MASERLQKILARAGVASRRAAEELITSGRVTVNGTTVTKLGSQADPATDHIKVDGRRIPAADAARNYFIAYKPRNMITSLADPEGRPTVADLLREHRVRARVFPVGRLDWDADGLVLLTDDGELANKVMHPRRHVEKRYQVKVKGKPSAEALEKLRRGVFLERGVKTLPALVKISRRGETTTWVEVTLVEGRQNQIKKMFERVGHPVRRLRRVSIGPLTLGRLRIGELRRLESEEVNALRAALAGAAGRKSPSRAKSRASRQEKGNKKRRPA